MFEHLQQKPKLYVHGGFDEPEPFIAWLLGQAHRRTPTGKMARIAIAGRDLYGFKLITESDLVAILREAQFTDSLVVKFLPRAKRFYQVALTKRERRAVKQTPAKEIKDGRIDMRASVALINELKFAANLKGVKYQTLIHEVLTDYVKNLRADV